MDEKKTRLVGASLFMAPLLSIPVKQERKKLWQAGGMEIWGLTATSNQTPSETFREICIKLSWVNCGPLTCEEKMTLAHQGQRIKRRHG